MIARPVNPKAPVTASRPVVGGVVGSVNMLLISSDNNAAAAQMGGHVPCAYLVRDL